MAQSYTDACPFKGKLIVNIFIGFEAMLFCIVQCTYLPQSIKKFEY